MKEGIALSRNNPDSIIVDVRRPEEYGSGHIPGAVILTMEKINEETAQAVLPDKNQMILIYCRSGNRSKIAAQMLVELGYQNVYEIGGIFDYSGEIEK
ncbi:MAG: rhodanese-like domain-containing protein [Treponema sp.]|nr:rhodanese-like domain-containing protein [Treponema sp.]